MREEESLATHFEAIFGFVPSFVYSVSDSAGRELVRQTLAELVNTFGQCQTALAESVARWSAVNLTELSREALLKLQSEQVCLRASSTEAQHALVAARQSARHFGYVVE